ncbi:MAG: hypothetical protein CFH01_00100 [Alphaproteobacteria bacterium MarineAlpha2_Bin1]|nr:MAG: hypothetical protein CFH01_00100 [Alphaproteobacteria bacterium MarineAlpha2_Bin1]
MPRHRGIYNPKNSSPYELSRTRVENFIRCPACFYLQQVKGVVFPTLPGFNLNEATDILLKRDFDKYRSLGKAHPFLVKLGKDFLIPYYHENFNLWTQSIHFASDGRMNFHHEPTNLKVGGGLDDVWLNQKTNELHIVDYKSTSQRTAGKKISLNDFWKKSYKRQMDFYVWIMLKKKLNVSKTGFFLYCDGDRFGNYTFLNSDSATMNFKMTLLSYSVDLSWVEDTLYKIKDCLELKSPPNHNNNCEYGKFITQIIEI